jgi:hypothetical protein
MAVKVTFDYEPDDPDPKDSTGMSSDEYEELHEHLMSIGADNIEIRRGEAAEAPAPGRPKPL